MLPKISKSGISATAIKPVECDMYPQKLSQAKCRIWLGSGLLYDIWPRLHGSLP